MRAAVVRSVEHECIASSHRAGAALNDRLDALAHRSQMHRHVRRVGNQIAFGVEQRAGKIEALLDVDRIRRVGERNAHLLGDRHEKVVEDLEQHRVRGRSDCMPTLQGNFPLEDEMVALGEGRRPARLDHRRRIFLGNDGRTRKPIARLQVFARVDRRRMPVAAGEHTVCFRARQVAAARKKHRRRFLDCRRGADGFHRHGLDHQRPCRHQEPVVSLIALFELVRERRDDVVIRAEAARDRNFQRRVRAVVLELQGVLERYTLRRDPLRFDFAARLIRELDED